MQRKRMLGLFSAITALVMILAAIQSSYAYSTVSGSWLISQAAAQSQGSAPRVIACGTFSLAVTGSSNLAADRGSFNGVLSFLTSYLTPGSPFLPASEQVSGTWMRDVTGALLVSFSGTQPVALAGSFSSPAVQPAPSTPTAPGCNSVSNQLYGFVQLPGQGTEGAFIYSNQLVTSFP